MQGGNTSQQLTQCWRDGAYITQCTTHHIAHSTTSPTMRKRPQVKHMIEPLPHPPRYQHEQHKWRPGCLPEVLHEPSQHTRLSLFLIFLPAAAPEECNACTVQGRARQCDPPSMPVTKLYSVTGGKVSRLTLSRPLLDCFSTGERPRRVLCQLNLSTTTDYEEEGRHFSVSLTSGDVYG